MGNITFISSPKTLTVEGMLDIFREVSVRRFAGMLVAKPVGEAWFDFEIHGEGWDIPLADGGIRSPKKFGSKPPHLDWQVWVWHILMAEVCAAVSGKMSDESQEGTYQPDASKYSTYRMWCAWLTPQFAKEKPTEFEEHVALVGRAIPVALRTAIETSAAPVKPLAKGRKKKA